MNRNVRQLVITLEFEVTDDDGYDRLDAVRVLRHRDTTLTQDQLDRLGDVVAQTDRWQVENWSAIQRVISGDREARLR